MQKVKIYESPIVMPFMEAFPAKILIEVRSYPGNDKCCDCSSLDTEWASISHGSLICLECAGKHRSLGVQVSFVRSITMDSWSPQQVIRLSISVLQEIISKLCFEVFLLFVTFFFVLHFSVSSGMITLPKVEMMRQGGNDQIRRFFRKLDMDTSGSINSIYCSKAADHYRLRLKERVAKILSGELNPGKLTNPSRKKSIQNHAHTRHYSEVDPHLSFNRHNFTHNIPEAASRSQSDLSLLTSASVATAAGSVPQVTESLSEKGPTRRSVEGKPPYTGSINRSSSASLRGQQGAVGGSIVEVVFGSGAMGLTLTKDPHLGALVSRLVPGGAAETGGVLVGDIVAGLSSAGMPGTYVRDYDEIMHMIPCLGRPINIQFLRRNKITDTASDSDIITYAGSPFRLEPNVRVTAPGDDEIRSPGSEVNAMRNDRPPAPVESAGSLLRRSHGHLYDNAQTIHESKSDSALFASISPVELRDSLSRSPSPRAVFPRVSFDTDDPFAALESRESSREGSREESPVGKPPSVAKCEEETSVGPPEHDRGSGSGYMSKHSVSNVSNPGEGTGSGDCDTVKSTDMNSFPEQSSPRVTSSSSDNLTGHYEDTGLLSMPAQSNTLRSDQGVTSHSDVPISIIAGRISPHGSSSKLNGGGVGDVARVGGGDLGDDVCTAPARSYVDAVTGQDAPETSVSGSDRPHSFHHGNTPSVEVRYGSACMYKILREKQFHA